MLSAIRIEKMTTNEIDIAAHSLEEAKRCLDAARENYDKCLFGLFKAVATEGTLEGEVYRVVPGDGIEVVRK